MKILLTGSTGQVGHAFQQQLKSDHQHQIICLNRQQFDLGDVDSIVQTIRTHQPDFIINPAAYTAVDLAEDEPELAHKINSIAPAVMAEEMKRLGGGFMHFSTDYVFNGEKATAYDENDTPAPLGEYGKSKLAGEQAIQAINGQHLIFRTSWVYSDFGKNFLLTMLRLAEQRDELKIVADQFGTPTNADFLATACRQVLNNTNQAWQERTGLYHLTPCGETTWFGFAFAILTRAKELQLFSKAVPNIIDISTEEYPLKAARPKNSRLATKRFQESFGIYLEDWQTGLEQCLNKINAKTHSQLPAQ
jgi:dTDP-4-dehydrorhamnose reductase